jgi:uncharacterized protein (DUF1330 family)
MKKFIFIITAIGLFSCNSFKQNRTMETIELEKNASEKVYVTALFYLKEDGIEKFEAYKANVGEVFAKHHGRVDKMIKPIKLVKGDMSLPDEIHFGVFDSEADFQATGKDVNYQKLVDSLRTPALRDLIVIISKDADSNVPLEIGDESKFYAITLLTIKEGTENKDNFNDYLSKSCAIMPDFGAHFEKFLIPTMVKGDMEKPSKVHLFYFDSMEGVQQMAIDPRMEALYPIRDEALSKANLILGKAL